MMCKKCGTLTGVLMLVVGILFLLRDLGVWDFWNIQWWTALFVIAGLCMLGKRCCKQCCACGKEGGKKDKK